MVSAWFLVAGATLAFDATEPDTHANAAERIDWAERVANSDMLTGLANARTLARVIELEVARASRQASERWNVVDCGSTAAISAIRARK